MKPEFGLSFSVDVCVEVMKLNLGQDSETMFDQYFEFKFRRDAKGRVPIIKMEIKDGFCH